MDEDWKGRYERLKDSLNIVRRQRESLFKDYFRYLDLCDACAPIAAVDPTTEFGTTLSSDEVAAIQRALRGAP